MGTMFENLSTRANKESGQTMAEYAVVLSVISIGVVITLGFLSTGINDLMSSVITSL